MFIFFLDFAYTAAVAVAKFRHKMVSSKVGGLRQDTKVWSQGLVGQKRCALKSSVQSVVWIYMQSCKVLQSAVRCPTRGILTLEREQKWEVKGLVGRCTVVMSTPVSEDLQQANCPGRVTTYKRITHTRICLYITHILTHSIFLQPGSSPVKLFSGRLATFLNLC